MTASPYPLPRDEDGRLAALSSLAIFNTAPEDSFDIIVDLAKHVFGVPIVLVSLVGKDTQIFKAKVGLEVCSTSKDVSFCAHAIVQNDVLVIPDATRDPRFSSNPLVTGNPFIRFYAGAPLIGPDGHGLGSLCIIDRKPRSLSEHDQITLKKMSRMVVLRMQSRLVIETMNQTRAA